MKIQLHYFSCFQKTIFAPAISRQQKPRVERINIVEYPVRRKVQYRILRSGGLKSFFARCSANQDGALLRAINLAQCFHFLLSVRQ